MIKRFGKILSQVATPKQLLAKKLAIKTAIIQKKCTSREKINRTEHAEKSKNQKIFVYKITYGIPKYCFPAIFRDNTVILFSIGDPTNACRRHLEQHFNKFAKRNRKIQNCIIYYIV